MFQSSGLSKWRVNTMSRDPSTPDTVSDDEVEFTIRRLHEYKSAMGDPDDDIANLIRILEILYGVEYDDFSENDVGTMHRVINEIDVESAQRLDPSFVGESQEDGLDVLVDIDSRVEHGGFEHVPLIGREGRQ